MVNWVAEVQRILLSRLAKNAGLRQHAVDVDEAGTIINFWVPEDKVPPLEKHRTANNEEKHHVVLLHGFAGDGMMTWGFQVGALAKHYHVYVPDLLQFGGSTSQSPDRSTGFQARCIATALRKLGVERCTVVGFSYGGFVAFKMAEAHPDLVRSLVVSGATVALTDAVNETMLARLGARTLVELLMPESVKRLRWLFSTAMYMKMWFPDRLLKDFLKVMYNNRKERAELLENLVIRENEALASAPVFQQNILLLWGEQDNFFTVDIATKLREELGKKATLRIISNAGHLAQLERPCVYNRCLKEFLAHVNAISPSILDS